MYRYPLLLLSCLALLSGCDRSIQDETHLPEATAKPSVGVYVVKNEQVPLIRELPGRTTAFNVAEVRPQVNGIILKRKFEEGSLVREGQELYEIDSAVYQASFNKALAHLNSMDGTRKRAEQLRESRTMSEQEYEDALFAWEQAKADVELARLNLAYCKVEAPLTGKIGRSMITVGALVTNGQEPEMAVIQQIDPIHVDLKPAVPQILRTKTASNDADDRLPFWQDATVTLTLEDGSRHPHSGKIKFLDNHVQEDTGTVTLRAEIPNPDGSLLPGMFVKASIEEGIRNDGKLIPQQALFRNMKGKPYVWIVGEGDKIERREVETALALGNTWLIDSGLEAGERIVVEGVQFIAPDTEVTPIDAENLEMKTSFE